MAHSSRNMAPTTTATAYLPITFSSNTAFHPTDVYSPDCWSPNIDPNDDCPLQAAPYQTRAYWTAAYTFTALIPITLILNILILMAFMKGYSKFKSVIFYWLSGQLVMTNMAYCIGHLIVTIPTTFWAQELKGYSNSVLYMFGIFLINFYAQALPIGIVVIALHRFNILVLTFKDLFKRNSLIVLLTIQWLIILLISCFLTIFNCNYRMIVTDSPTSFYELDASYIFTCNSASPAVIGLLSTIYQAEQICLPCVDLVLYATMTGYLLIIKKCAGMGKTPYILLIPPMLMFLAVAGSTLASIILLSQTMTLTTGLLINRLTAIGDLIASSLIPIIIFATNSDVRKEIFSLFQKEKKQPTPVQKALVFNIAPIPSMTRID